jgi:hypothetical protein
VKEGGGERGVFAKTWWTNEETASLRRPKGGKS